MLLKIGVPGKCPSNTNEGVDSLVKPHKKGLLLYYRFEFFHSYFSRILLKL